MKKLIKNIFLALVLSIVSIFSVLNLNSVAFASNEKSVSLVSKPQITGTINFILNDFVKFNKRFPGEDDEKNAATYIKNY